MIKITPNVVTSETYIDKDGNKLEYQMNVTYMGKHFISLFGQRITPNSFKNKGEAVRSLIQFIKNSGGIKKLNSLNNEK